MPHNQDPLGAPLERVESFQYPSGHLGHLSQQQEGALVDFKKLAEQKGYYTPTKDRQHPATHDDETLLRYLRARKFVPQDGFGQFKDTEDWRQKNKINDLYENIDITEYEETRKLYPQWIGRSDKRGIPIYVFEVAALTSKRLAEYEKRIVGSHPQARDGIPPKLIRLFALYENLIRFTFPFCGALPGRPYAETPVSQSNNIVDISNVSLKQFWNLKDHMQLASTLATAYYPETLDRIFIIGAPSFFPTVWGWVKRWFDPITVSKIFILGQKEMMPTLEKYIDVESIPKKYGGKLDWTFDSPPTLDKLGDSVLQWKMPAKDGRGHNTFPPGPIKWRKVNGDMVAMAVGSEHGKQRNDLVAILSTHGQDLNLATVLSQDFGPASTNGIYTHPADDSKIDYFASSSTEMEQEGGSAMDANVSEKEVEGPGQNAYTTVLPMRDAEHSTQSTYSPSPLEGTSTTNYTQQHGTHTEEHISEGRYIPAASHHGASNYRNTSDPQLQQDNSYYGQAKAAASAVYTTAASTATSVLGQVGLVNQQDQPEQTGGTTSQHARNVSEDPRVSKMEDEKVEEFIRGQYVSSADHGKGK